MRFKRAMAASMAAVMAVSSAVVCQVTASAYEAPGSITMTNCTPNFILGDENKGYDGKSIEITSVPEAAGSNSVTVNLTMLNDAYGWSNGQVGTNSSAAGDWVSDSYKATSAGGTSKAGDKIQITLDTYVADNGDTILKVEEYGGGAIIIDSIEYSNGYVYEPVRNRIAVVTKDNSLEITKVEGAAGSTSLKATIVMNNDGDGWSNGQVGTNSSAAGDWVSDSYKATSAGGTSKAGDKIEINLKTYVADDGSTHLKFEEYGGGIISVVSIEYSNGYVLNADELAKKEVPVSDVKIAAPAKTTYNVGDDVTLTASVNDDATVEDKDIVWSSDNTDVATVDETTGKVTFVGAGNVTVTAAYKSDKTIKDTVALKAEKKKVTATITAGDVTGATKEDAADKAKAAVKVVSADLTDKDYTVSVKVDGRKYMATVVLTEEAAKKYELTGTNTAGGKIAYKVTGLKLSTNKLAIPVTSTAGVKITATIQPEDLADGEIEWKTADNTVATVEDGLVKPVSGSAGGKTTITATVKGTTYSADCEVSIAEVINPATAIKLDKSELSGTAGDKAELKADVTAKDDTKECTDAIIWESSDKKVATVNAGSVTFVGEGTAEIIVTAGDVSAACKVTVKAKTVAVEKVTLDKTSAELTVGGTAALKATVTPDNATDKTVTWTSSDESVATVKDGTVTAVKAGKAVITAKAGDQTAKCTVTVKAKEEKPEEKPDPAPAVNDKEIWSGSTDLGTDWGKSVTVPKADVKIGDTIRIKVSTGSAEYHQVKIMDSNWEVLSSVKSKADAQYGTITVDKDGYVEFKVNAADAKLISEGGLIISGYDLTVSAVSSRAMKEETYAPSTKVHTVVNNGASQIAVFAISEEDAEKYESYTIIITRGSDGKSVYEIVDGCYKYVSYNNGSENVRVSGNGAYYIMLDITGIEDSFGGITVRIVPTVPKG